MQDPAYDFRPHDLTAYLIAKTFLDTDEIGKTMVWVEGNGWRLTDEGDTLFPEHREILYHIYEFVLGTGIFGRSTDNDPCRRYACEEIEMAARKISLARQQGDDPRPDVCKEPIWGAAAWDIFGTLER